MNSCLSRVRFVRIFLRKEHRRQGESMMGKKKRRRRRRGQGGGGGGERKHDNKSPTLRHGEAKAARWSAREKGERYRQRRKIKVHSSPGSDIRCSRFPRTRPSRPHEFPSTRSFPRKHSAAISMNEARREPRLTFRRYRTRAAGRKTDVSDENWSVGRSRANLSRDKERREREGEIKKSRKIAGIGARR